MATDELFGKTHDFLNTCLDHLDRVLAEGAPLQRQQALAMKDQVRQIKDRLEERKKQGKKFEAREVHVLEHVIPVYSRMIPPLH